MEANDPIEKERREILAQLDKLNRKYLLAREPLIGRLCEIERRNPPPFVFLMEDQNQENKKLAQKLLEQFGNGN